MNEHVPPSVHEVTFTCPHCATLSPHFWFELTATRLDEHPSIWTREMAAEEMFERLKDDPEERRKAKMLVLKLGSGLPIVTPDNGFHSATVHNIWLSRCFKCDGISIWLHDDMIWPKPHEAPVANPELPDDLKADYLEAAQALSFSPRSSAAILRLCVRKLCSQLGGGDNIDQAVASLVAKGLDVRIQQALRILGVIGSEAVLPGTLDQRDDRATAEELFALVNLIATAMISQPKHIEEMYAKLPPVKLSAIEKRDGKISAPTDAPPPPPDTTRRE